MTVLQFLLLEITILLVLRIYKIEAKGCIFFIVGYSIWFVFAFLFCLEIIPYHPDYARFNGPFEAITDYLLLFVTWALGFVIIPAISKLINSETKQFNSNQLKRTFLLSAGLFLIVGLWGWLGIFSTPTIKNRIFVKSNPTFKFSFETTFDRPVTCRESQKLKEIKSETNLIEELKFMEYVANKDNWK
jgi:hypothetical protein